jgi:hypothetical protein
LGLAVDQIQEQLLRAFPGELAVGEARMYAMGWTVPIVREGLVTLASQDGRDPDPPGLESIDVSRWLRGEHRPRVWLQPLCRLFQCHQAKLGWPPQGNEQPIDFSEPAEDAAPPAMSTPSGRPRAVFIQYLNPEILQLYGVGMHLDARRVARVALLLSRYAILVADGLLVMPASYLFEVPHISEFLRCLAPVRDAGLLGFTSPSPDLGQYVPAKRHEYRGERTLFPAYFDSRDDTMSSGSSLLWVPRVERSSAEDITAAWRSELTTGGLWDRILARSRRSGRGLPSRADGDIDAVPDRLDGRAFVARYAHPLIPLSLSPRDETLVSLLISRSYLESYLTELGALILSDTPLGALDCGIAPIGPAGTVQRVSWRVLSQVFSYLNLREAIDDGLSLQDLIKLRMEPPLRWLVNLLVEDSALCNLSSTRAVLDAALRISDREHHTKEAGFDAARDILWRLWEATIANAGSEAGVELPLLNAHTARST